MTALTRIPLGPNSAAHAFVSRTSAALLAPYSDVPRAYVVLQRINLGLYAVIGSLHATANWRRIAEEIWPFVNGPASTPIGEAEARWEAELRPELSQVS